MEPLFHYHKNSSVASCLCLFSLENVERLSKNVKENTSRTFNRFYVVVVSTLDSECKDPSSNLSRTSFSLPKNSIVASCLCLFSLENVERLSKNVKENTSSKFISFNGVVVSTLDFESKDPSSNLGRTSFSLSQKLQCSFVYVCFLWKRQNACREKSSKTQALNSTGSMV